MPEIITDFERTPLSTETVEAPVSIRARTFCQLMQSQSAPSSFNAQVIKQLKEWKLINSNIELPLGNNREVRKVINEAHDEAEKNSPEFIKAFRENPWNFDWSVEGEYQDDELVTLFPIALEIKKILPDNPRVSFRVEPGGYYLKLLTREDGKRQVIRIIDTPRDIAQINYDAKKAPSIIPPFEAIRLSSGEIALLIQWMEGHVPSTNEEEMLCLKSAEQLLKVPIVSYDLWVGNFLVSDQLDAESGKPKIFYIDRDIPQAIAKEGLSWRVPRRRRQEFNNAKERRNKEAFW